MYYIIQTGTWIFLADTINALFSVHRSTTYDDKYTVSDLGFNHCTIMPPVGSN